MISHSNTAEDLRIAIIDHVGNKAGMDYYDLSLLNSLSKLSIKTFLFSNFYKNMENIYMYKFFNSRIRIPLFKVFNFITGYIRSVFYCKYKKIDVLILHIFSSSFESLFRIAIAKLFRLNVFLIVHDILSFHGKESNFIRKLIFNTFADQIIVHNKFSYNDLQGKVAADTGKKIHIIKHGNYCLFIKKSYSKQYVAKKLKLDTSKQYILFFGQIKKAKGLDVLLKAMPLVYKNIILIIAGKLWKNNFSVYQEIIDNFGLRKRIKKYIRHITDEERDFFFHISDALIIPYKLIYQSGVLLMGMSYGLPVIVSDLKPNREIIKNNKNGLLFKSGDEVSLAKKINSLLQDRDLMGKICANACQTAEVDHSWDKIAEQYLAILK